MSLSVFTDPLTMPPQLQSQNQNSPRILQGDLQALSPAVRKFIESSVALCQPDSLHICDGSDEENRAILSQLEEQGMVKKLQKYDNWYVKLRCYAYVKQTGNRRGKMYVIFQTHSIKQVFRFCAGV